MKYIHQLTKTTCFVIGIVLLFLGCENVKNSLVIVENDQQINLSNIDSVRKNLDGFWIIQDVIDSEEEILWLSCQQEGNSIDWNMIPYKEESRKTKTITIESCQPVVSLIQIKGKICIEFINLVGADTLEIEYLSKTRFELGGTTYLRHQGYDFLK